MAKATSKNSKRSKTKSTSSKNSKNSRAITNTSKRGGRRFKTMDGNEAAAYASYPYTEVAAMYPITPSSVMAEHTDEWSVIGKKNIFGKTVDIREMQSESGAAGTVHGALSAGALTTTYTASQGLLLMIPNIYKIAGEGLPGVFHVSARAVATHALSIFGDHSDVYACRQTGACMMAESSVQEVMDLTPVAHLAAIEARLPFINFFDGFRTSHEIQKIEVWDDHQFKSLADMKLIQAFKDSAMNPNHPTERGQAQNPDTFFQSREASNLKYEKAASIVQKYMDKVNQMIGTDYKLFNYYGHKNADHVIVAMGSVCDAVEQAVRITNERTNQKVGLIRVHLYRPFDVKSFLRAIPKTCKYLSVLDRTKEPGSIGEPLYLDVIAAIKGTKYEKIKVQNGRYGLGSKDASSGDMLPVLKNETKDHFVIGIEDDVTYLSFKPEKHGGFSPKGTKGCKFWGLGSDGTVGANKNSIKIIGDNTNLYAQGYFDYDSRKSGGLTVSHLRFGKNKIKSSYLLAKSDFVACHNAQYIHQYDMITELRENGTFLINCPWSDEELEKQLSNRDKRYLAVHHARLFAIDAVKLAEEIGLGPTRTNTILQAAFFKLSNIIPIRDAITYMKEAIVKTYSNKGEDIVKKNQAAIDAGIEGVREIKVKNSWKNLKVEKEKVKSIEKLTPTERFVETIQKPINRKKGDKLPVSAFIAYKEGEFPVATSKYEKRGVAVKVPKWNKENCIECNFCSFTCPHAAIRPVVMDKNELKNAPKGMESINLNGFDKYNFSICVSQLDCTGCGVCQEVCPGMKGEKAITMVDIAEEKDKQKYFDYADTIDEKDDVIEHYKETTIKGSQFKKPLLEFSGACAGCGESPYAKIITQLFGDRMYIANATGCTSIWGNSSPNTPYTTNKKGRGPAWNNSLFEDNAEFGYGMYLAAENMRKDMLEKAKLLASDAPASLKQKLMNYINTSNNSHDNLLATDELVPELMKSKDPIARELLKNKNFLSKKSQWIFGGDGWAYDIGFGGVDHVLATGEDVNLMVFDTEVYSNTGGQASKATPTGAVAKFASGGKNIKKKDIAEIAMSYGYVYVAQVSMGYDMNQCLQALIEAENYNGPSLIIAYAPCINHGIKKGMNKTQLEEKLAVECGYWQTFRYNPSKPDHKFTLDSAEPNFDKYLEFLDGEVRYNSLKLKDKERAIRLFEQNMKEAKEKYLHLKNKVEV